MMCSVTAGMEALKEEMKTIAQDVLSLCEAVMPQLPPEEAPALYAPQQFTETVAFEEFCAKLDEIMLAVSI